jgi:tellurite resistance protein
MNEATTILTRAAVCGLKLALAGVGAAQTLSIPIFVAANLFIGYLCLRTAWRAVS